MCVIDGPDPLGGHWAHGLYGVNGCVSWRLVCPVIWGLRVLGGSVSVIEVVFGTAFVGLRVLVIAGPLRVVFWGLGESFVGSGKTTW